MTEDAPIQLSGLALTQLRHAAQDALDAHDELLGLADTMATALHDLLMAGNHHNCGACTEIHATALNAVKGYDAFKKARR